MNIDATTGINAYVIEQYLPSVSASEVDVFAKALMAAAASIKVDVDPLRLACSVLIPDDDLCLYVLKAASQEAASQAAELAAITPERVIPAIAWLIP